MNNLSLIKQNISKAFNKAWRTYDAHCAIQKKTGNILINQLSHFIKAAPVIVDYGCGTGLITESLALMLSYQHFYALDISKRLLAIAQQRFTAKYQISIVQADFEETIIDNNVIDLAFSNLALQWGTSLDSSLKCIFSQLKPFGVLAFSLPLKGSLKEIRSDSCNSFYEFKEVIHLLVENGYRILASEQLKLVEEFLHLLEALKSLKAVGANYVVGGLSSSAIEGKASVYKIIKTAGDCLPKCELSYQMGFFIAQKKIYD